MTQNNPNISFTQAGKDDMVDELLICSDKAIDDGYQNLELGPNCTHIDTVNLVNIIEENIVVSFLALIEVQQSQLKPQRIPLKMTMYWSH